MSFFSCNLVLNRLYSLHEQKNKAKGNQMKKATTKIEIKNKIILTLSGKKEIFGIKRWGVLNTTWKRADTALRKSSVAFNELEKAKIIISVFEKRPGYRRKVRCYSLNNQNSK